MYTGKQKPLPPISVIRKLIHYNPVTGFICNHTGIEPSIASIRVPGYSQYFKHRIAYAHYHGVDPGDLVIDHADGDPTNNRIENLRLATRSQNTQNSVKPSSNTSGYKGVSKWRDKWQARIGLPGYSKYLGLFNTPEEAHAAYCDASEKYHKEFGKAY